MNRRIRMLRAAMPHFDEQRANLIDTLVHAEELSALMSGTYCRTDLSLCESECSKPELSSILQDIKPFCNQKEQKLVNQMLQFCQMSQMMEMVRMMKDIMPESEGGDGEGQEGGTPFSSLFGDMPLEDMMEFFSSMMGGFGKDETE